MEIQTGGSDTLNSGLFDTASTGKPTDLTTNANTANTSAPIVSSATYNFVAQDIGNWLYIQAGTNWIPGWYNITAVSGNKATLNAAIGAAILANFTASTAVGVASVGTPTAGVWAVDYSQQGGVQFSLTGLTTAAANAILLSASFTKAMVGNGVQITGGTNFTTGFYQINAVTAGVSATVDRNVTTAAGLAGTAGLGGSLASPGQAAALMVNGADVWMKTGTYTQTSSSSNVAAGLVSITANGTGANMERWEGYGTLRGDKGTRPEINAGALTTVIMVTLNGNLLRWDNINVNGNLQTSTQGMKFNGNSEAVLVLRTKVLNCTNNALTISTGSVSFTLCEINGCTTAATIGGAAQSSTFYDCTFQNNTVTGASGNGHIFINCLSINNTGATSDGFLSANNAYYFNCTSYGNGRDGFRFTLNTGTVAQAVNCLSVGNGVTAATGYGFNASAAWEFVTLINCAAQGNLTADTNTATITGATFSFVSLSVSPFTNAAGGNFALTPAAIALLAGIPGSYPGLASTTGYLFIGAVQPARSGPMGAPIIAMAGDLAIVE